VLGLPLLVLACAVVAIAAGVTIALLRPESLLDAAISLGVVATAGIVAAMHLSGSLSILTPAALLGAVALWGLVAAALFAWRRPSLSWLEVPRPALRRHPWASALVALAVLGLAWQLLVALVLPPFAFDALGYHLTLATTWVQTQSLDPTAPSLCCAYYPGNPELLFVWPIAFTGSDSLVDTVQFGFVALGALATAGIVRTAGLSRASAAAAAGIFAATPIVLVQAPTNYVDVIVAALVLAGLYGLTRFAVTGAWQRLVVAGLAAGLLLGTKGTGIVWAVALGLGAVVLVIIRIRRSRLPARAGLAALAGFLVACLALGGYWYARNWIETGNPGYPFEIEVAGVEVFDGPKRIDDVLTRPELAPDAPWPIPIVRSWAADLLFWRQGSYEYEQRPGGLGPLWPWLALPLLVPVTVALVRRRSPVLLVVGLVALVFLVQPYAWWARFTIPLIAIGALAIVAAAAWAPRMWMRRAVQTVALLLAAGGVALSSYEVDPASLAEPLPAGDLVGLIGEPAEERTIEQLFFPEYRFLEDIPEDATVVVDLGAPQMRWVYPLFGPEHTRDVEPASPAGTPADAWVVTTLGRELDRTLAADGRFTLDFEERELRVWRPAG
jgi:hypothetical protein